ncbi:MAG: cyclic lactone autoinducer peptide [Floccifex sp.]
MKKYIVKFSGLFAALALCVTTLTANSTCVFCMHQSKMPVNSKKLRKF